MGLDLDNTFITVNNYIDSKFNNVVDYTEAINCFRNLDEFLTNHNFSLNIDIAIRLINENKNFAKLIGLIVRNYHLSKENKNILEMFDIDALISGLEAYFTLSPPVSEGNNVSDISIYNIYLNEVKNIPLLSIDEERELAKKVANGDNEARKKFIESNLRLVINVAITHLNQGLPFLDLIQEGNLGLIRAVDKYDVNKEVKFSTYAVYWIDEKIRRAIISKTRNIRIPDYLYYKVMSYKHTANNLKLELNRSPSLSEVANKMELSIEQVSQLHKLQKDTISVNELIDEKDDNDLTKYFFVSDKNTENDVINKALSIYVKKLLDECNLNKMELTVLLYRFGFIGNKPLYLSEIARMCHLTRQRIWDIERRALLKLRLFDYTESLVDYTENPDKSLQYLQERRNEFYTKKRSKGKGLK